MGKKKYRKKAKSKLIGNFAAIFLFFLVCIGIFAMYLLHDLPDVHKIVAREFKPQILIYDQNNVLLARYGESHVKYLSFSQIPSNIINAVISAEDKRFFQHSGVDVLGVIRAYITNIRSMKVVQGGSTITQQLAKIIWLSSEKTLKRKFQELIIAFQLESNFSKEQIIALYLNRVYLGRGNYGIEAASQHYFGKSVSDLGDFEAAFLAALLKAPSKYSAEANFKAALDRAKYVLSNMYKNGYITEADYKRITPPTIVQRGVARGAMNNPYFTDYVINELSSILEVIDCDISVYTTLDISLQERLENKVSDYMKVADEKYNAKQVAAISMQPDGAIKAMVGGYSYTKSQFNRAVLAKRQPGSAFKFFVYLSALENGIDINDVMKDEPISFPQGPSLPKWEPRNYDRKYYGDMTICESFAHSINTITVKLLHIIGIDNVIELASRLGVKSDVPKLLSIALGTSQISLLELTQSYAHIANSGYQTNAYSVLKVVNSENQVLYDYIPSDLNRVISEDVVSDMKVMLKAVVEEGKGKGAKIKGVDIYGKTGTTQDHRDAWFIGFTDELVTGIWMGNDDYTVTKSLTGGKLPATIFKEYHTAHFTKTEHDDSRMGNIFNFFR